jgi:uncharacterized pyridoxal phosphate-containing UPF0001 family protein
LNELDQKSKSEEILQSCPEIKWHFIGNLQKKAVNKVSRRLLFLSLFKPKITCLSIKYYIEIKNLYLVETIDSLILADKLNKAWETKRPNENIRVMIQVNTSGEARN